VAADRVATAIRALAGSIRAGAPPRVALEKWHPIAPVELQPALREVAHRLVLGGSIDAAVADASSLPNAVARCFALHRAAGGSLPAMLDGVADGVERDEEARRGSQAATAGARLSGRLVAGLPLAFVPLTSGGGALRSGAAGLLLLLAGGGLGAAGLWWIGKLVPSVSPADGAATFADDLAVALAGGIGLVPALDAVAARPPEDLEDAIGRARRRARLGQPWVEALAREGPALAGLAQVLARSCSAGIAAATPLREWAQARRAEVRTEHRRALQRAPVLMVVPLTVCVLPSFALLAFGPFVLGAMGSR
jgi:tight adherence protein B